MSVRNSITGPFAEITVGKDSYAVVFNIPKQLLCDSSTYFNAALNNGFAETATQKITLDDDDPEIFRTYAAWLFEHEISEELPEEYQGGIQPHLFRVFFFADKRGIRVLANDVVTKISSLWVAESIDMHTTIECLPQLPSGCTLYDLVLDSLVLASRDGSWNKDHWTLFCSHPKDIMIELFRREQDFPDTFCNHSDCFNSICHYHEHIDSAETSCCIEKIERGRNVYAGHEGPWKQVLCH